MLRLNLKDENETALFIDPYRDSIMIRKSCSLFSYGDRYVLSIEAGSSPYCLVTYKSEESRDEAYEYVLNKINEYLFPQKDSYTIE